MPHPCRIFVLGLELGVVVDVFNQETDNLPDGLFELLYAHTRSQLGNGQRWGCMMHADCGAGS